MMMWLSHYVATVTLKAPQGLNITQAGREMPENSLIVPQQEMVFHIPLVSLVIGKGSTSEFLFHIKIVAHTGLFFEQNAC